MQIDIFLKMRKTILYFITILFFNNPLAAEDITQISISGVKFGDSLLNYAIHHL